jgi:aryl-alcohol dehydrogenase-like predicted oxidoreductase
MKRRKLGSSDIYVSEISFGGVEIGLPYGLHRQFMPEHDAINLLLASVDKGINFFDTARMYGCSEERMGKAFGSIRDKIVISSKCPHLRDENRNIRSGRALTAFLTESLEASLKALNTDYIDVYLAHSVDREILERNEVAQAFCDLKSKGHVRSIGVSTYGLADAELAIKCGLWNVIQLAFNLMDQTAAALLPLAHEKGVGIMVRSVLMRGILTDSAPQLAHEKLKTVNEHRKRYFAELDDQCPLLSDLATRFVLSFEDVSSVLVGIDKQEFLNKAVDLADGKYFSSERLSRLQALAYPDPAFLDLAAWDRNGWTK